MKTRSSKTLIVLAAAAGLTFAATFTQAPTTGGALVLSAQGGGGRGGGRGRGGLPDATPEQTQAVVDMNAALASLVDAATEARNELATAAMAQNSAGMQAAVTKLGAAELAVATARAQAFAELQAGPNRLNADQVTALIAAGGNVGGRGGFRGGGPGGGGRAGAGRGN